MLLGPLKALSYLLEHGLSSAALGALWRWRVHWSLSMAAGSVVRITSTAGVLALSSWALNEDLVALLMSNAYSMLVSILGMACGCVATPFCHAHQHLGQNGLCALPCAANVSNARLQCWCHPPKHGDDLLDLKLVMPAHGVEPCSTACFPHSCLPFTLSSLSVHCLHGSLRS